MSIGTTRRILILRRARILATAVSAIFACFAALEVLSANWPEPPTQLVCDEGAIKIDTQQHNDEVKTYLSKLKKLRELDKAEVDEELLLLDLEFRARLKRKPTPLNWREVYHDCKAGMNDYESDRRKAVLSAIGLFLGVPIFIFVSLTLFVKIVRWVLVLG